MGVGMCMHMDMLSSCSKCMLHAHAHAIAVQELKQALAFDDDPKPSPNLNRYRSFSRRSRSMRMMRRLRSCCEMRSSHGRPILRTSRCERTHAARLRQVGFHSSAVEQPDST